MQSSLSRLPTKTFLFPPYLFVLSPQKKKKKIVYLFFIIAIFFIGDFF